MKVEMVSPSDVSGVVSVLQAAAHWLAENGNALWSPTDFSEELLAADIAEGQFFAAWIDGSIAGVVKFQLEDPVFWPEDKVGTSAFVHKLAVCREFAGSGVSTALLAFARGRAELLGLQQLRLDCVADRLRLRQLYEDFGFKLHSIVKRWGVDFARYELVLGNN